jgi:hypothetical protein
MLKLPNVTLIALSGLDYDTEGNIEALKKSCEGIEWGDVKYVQQASITDISSWNKAVIYDLHNYISTDFAMFIHADGYVINPSAWRPDFLSYDFIGAPWPLPRDDYSYRTREGELIRVGNSVSIRSRRLLGLPSSLGLEWREYYGNTNEDGFLCVHNRGILEENGCTFAPLEVAKYFSKEHETEENEGIETFAFHSL